MACRVASRMLEAGSLKAVVVRGTDVVVVSHLGRMTPARLQTAVEELFHHSYEHNLRLSGEATHKRFVDTGPDPPRDEMLTR